MATVRMKRHAEACRHATGVSFATSIYCWTNLRIGWRPSKWRRTDLPIDSQVLLYLDGSMTVRSLASSREMQQIHVPVA